MARREMRRYLVGVLICAACFGVQTVHAEEPVYFADANLKAQVEATLGKMNPTPTDMLELTSLNVYRIASLTGLEHAANLQTLSVPGTDNTEISDLSPLSGLTNLRDLRLSHKQISDLSPLSGLTSLGELVLQCNQIANLSPLAGLTDLTLLALWSNRITDVSPLSGLTKLELLSLEQNQISSIPSLSGLTSLRHLYLHSNQISDISPLAGLTNLEQLFVSSNPISDISPLSGLMNLHSLHLEYNQIGDISPLSGLTNLSWLMLTGNHISDISGLSGLTRMRLLYLAGNQISDISALSGLANLERLELQFNQISNIQPLAELTGPGLLGLALWDNPLNRDAYCVWLAQIRINDPAAGLGFSPNANPPGGVSATDGGYPDKVHITWTALCPGPGRTDVFQYMVYRSIALYGPKQAVSEWLSGTSFDDTTASPGVHYWYWVKSDKSGKDYSDPDEGWYAPPRRTLAVTSTTGGTVSAPGIGSFQYDEGTSVPVVASPAANYHFVNWTGTAVTAGKVANPSSASTTVAMDGDYTLQANFAVDQRTLTTSSTAGGSVTTPGEGAFSYAHGTLVAVVATAEANYHFVSWTGTAATAGKVADPSSSSTTVTMDGDYTLVANFAVNTYTLTLSAVNGTVTATPVKANYTHGETVTLQAVPNTGYHFTEWTGDLTSSSNPTTVTMDGDKTVTANFTVCQRTLTVSAGSGGAVTTPGQGAFQYDHGTALTVMAASAADHHFVSWTGTAVDAGKVASPSSATTTVTIDADYTLQAHFAVDRRTVTVSTTAGGSVLAPGEGAFQYDHGQVIALQAQADPLFTFVGWQGNVFTSSNPYSLTIDADVVLTAHFESVLDVLYVDDDAAGDPGPGDPSVSDPQENGTAEHPFDRVQEAIDVARAGVRIMVRPGTYFETIDLLGKAIEVNGLNADDASILPLPVIDGAGEGTVVRCTHGEDPKCVLQGLVITGGKGWQAGGVLCLGSSPTILNCLIVGNRATALDAGGGIYCQDSKAMFVNCTISGNSGGSAGAGVYLSNSGTVVLDSIVWANTPTQIKLLGSASSLVAYTTVAGGWPRDGNLRADPLFVLPGYWADPANLTTVLPATDPLAVWVEGDYHLMSQGGRWDPISGTWVKDLLTSPCLDAGAPESPIGSEPVPNGGRINMGVYGGTSQASKSGNGN